MTDVVKTICANCKEYVEPSMGGHAISCPECGYSMYNSYLGDHGEESEAGRRFFAWLCGFIGAAILAWGMMGPLDIAVAAVSTLLMLVSSAVVIWG